MKKIILALFVALSVCSISAQDLATTSTQTVDLSDLYQIDKSFGLNQQTYLFKQDPCKDKRIGRDLLISGGCFMGVGLIAYPLGFQFIDGSRAVGGLCTIGGLTCIGAAIPMFIAGSVLYVRGKNNCVNMSANGLTIKF